MGLGVGGVEAATDEEIVQRILAGRHDEFGFLVLRYQARIYSLLMRQVGDREIATELAQDTFVRAFRAISSFQSRSSVQTWLIRIALNVSNSYFSSRAFRQRRQTVSFVQEAHEGEQTHTEDTALMERRIADLQVALGALPQKYREPLVLCRLERKSYAEAGALLGIPEGTVCSRINTAVAKLRRHFERQRK